jgi:filamentous hemagglutinin family protein
MFLQKIDILANKCMTRQLFKLTCYLRLGGAITLSGCFVSVFSGNYALAQIAPDTTLGAESSVSTPLDVQGLPIDRIDGGAIRGTNLFHSFLEFNVAANRGAYFFSPANNQNILARVTGTNPSQILGTLGTFGASSPNLFLINPNGIIFGQNASLDVGGSFVATTASAIQFGNQGFFSATNPQPPALLLTIAPSAFFFTAQANPGSIISQSRVTQTVQGNPTDGLKVPNGQTLLLLGGNVTVDNGRLIARGGRVEIGAVAGAGTVGLNPNGSLSVPDGMQRADVVFINYTNSNRSGIRSGIDVRHGNGGDIGITAGNINILGGTQLRAGIATGLGTPQSQGGNLIVNATGEIRMTGDDTRMANDLRENAQGKAGNLMITTNSLVVADGAQLSASTFGSGDAGNVVIVADYVSFSGARTDERGVSAAFSRVEYEARGNGGTVQIFTNVLEVSKGAVLFTSTDGLGNAGNVVIVARDRVSFDGISPLRGIASGTFSGVSPGAEGKGGNVQISTNTLEVTNGSQLGAFSGGTGDAGNIVVNDAKTVNITGTTPLTGRSSGLFTSTSSVGKGGDIIINTQAFRLTDGAVLGADTYVDDRSGSITVNAATVDILNGGQMLATTQGNGRAGNITINASDRVTIAGIDPTFTERLAQFGDRVAPLTPNSGIFVRSQASGGAGEINVSTPTLQLDRGILSAESATVDGGNINLNVPDILLLRNGSLISATAGTAQQGGNGGNIKINTSFIVGVPKENSDITANAFQGQGGNINITTQGIYGLKFRPRLTPLSDITASSEFGLDGEFQLDLLTDVDPSRGLAQLTTSVVDASDQIDRRCTPVRSTQERNSFTITGRGGLPLSPNDPLQSESIITNWVTIDSDVETKTPPVPITPKSSTPKPLVEAQGWMLNHKGEVVLTASALTGTPQGEWFPEADCDEPAVQRQ